MDKIIQIILCLVVMGLAYIQSLTVTRINATDSDLVKLERSTRESTDAKVESMQDQLQEEIQEVRRRVEDLELKNEVRGR